MENNKKCKECGEVKPIEKFSDTKAYKSGKSNKCKECTKIYQREYKKRTRGMKSNGLADYLKIKLLNIIDQDKKKFPEYESKLTEEDLMNIYQKYNGCCVYSRKKLKVGSDANIYSKISFDRIDNCLPHSANNLQLTSQFMNMLRGSKTHQQFLSEICQ